MRLIKLFRKSFSYRVMGGFLLVLALMYLLYFGIFKAGYNMLTDEISRLLYTKASFLTDTLEGEIARILKLQNECLNDDILYYTSGAFPIMTKSEQTKSLLEMQNRLKVLHESSTYIDEVFVYMPGLNRKISSVEGVELMEGEPTEMKRMQEKSQYTPLFYDQGNMYLGASFPYNMVSMKVEPRFTLVIRLSKTELQNTLNFLGEYPDSGVKLLDSGGEYELNVGEYLNLNETDLAGEQWPCQVTDLVNRREYMMFRLHSAYLDMDLYAYISNQTIYADLYNYRNIFLLCLTMVMIMLAGYLYSTYLVLNDPLNTLVNTIEQMEKGDLSVRISEEREDEFGRVYDVFNRMAQSLQNQMEINYKQKLLTQQAQLRHLQSQINPHFLYNSFFSIYRMAKAEDCESITELTAWLSEYYRYITKSAKSDTELAEEVKHARRYAQIQAMRFKRRLTVDFEELPAEYEQIIVPRLILQPLLENAFDHGLSNVEKGGVLKIWYECREGRLLVHVQDNGAGMTRQELETLRADFLKTGETIEDGLVNIDRRLKLKFGDGYGIEMHAEEGKGTLCSLILPAGRSEEDERNVQGAGGGR